MSSAKTLTTSEIIHAYGVDCEESEQAKILATMAFTPVNSLFDKFAIMHWLMSLGVPFASRSSTICNHWKMMSNGTFNYITVLDGVNKLTGQPRIGFKPYRRHPIQNQIEEFEMWLNFVKPESSSAFGDFRRFEVWDKNQQQRYKYFMMVRSDGSVVVHSGMDIAHTGIDIFDSIHWLKDNLCYSAELYQQNEQEHVAVPRFVTRRPSSLAESMRVAIQPHAFNIPQEYFIQAMPGAATVSVDLPQSTPEESDEIVESESNA